MGIHPRRGIQSAQWESMGRTEWYRVLKLWGDWKGNSQKSNVAGEDGRGRGAQQPMR